MGRATTFERAYLQLGLLAITSSCWRLKALLEQVDKDKIILIESGETLQSCNGLLGKQSLQDNVAKEEPSTSIGGPSRSHKGECTNTERADPMGGSSSSYSCTVAVESDHDPKVKVAAGLITQKNVTVKHESIADENHDDFCLKTEKKDSPLQLVVSTNVESIKEQKLDAPKDTNGNADESSKAVHGGAVWDIFRREDIPKLIEYLKRHKHEFRHLYNEPVKSVFHPIHDQSMFLNERQKKQLKEEFDIEPWTFEQHLGEAVFIPAGCPHQVRNIQSCIKVALDFVAPESVEECLRLTEEFRRLPKDHRSNEDKLELKKIVLHAASSAIREANKLMQKSHMSKEAQPAQLSQLSQRSHTYEACRPPIIHQYARRKAHMSKEAQQKRST